MLKFRRYKKYLIILGLGILMGGMIYLAKRDRGVIVDTYSVAITKVSDIYTEDGIVKVGEKQILVSKVSGDILSIPFMENDIVKAGDILLLIDSKDLESQREVLIANRDSLKAKKGESDISKLMTTSPSEYLKNVGQSMEAAQVVFDTAQREYEAKQVLLDSGSASQIELDVAKTNLENARVNLETARNRHTTVQTRLQELRESGLSENDMNVQFYQSVTEQLNANIRANEEQIQQLDRQIADCTIVATNDSMISKIPVKEASFISAGQEIIHLQQLDKKIQIETEVLTDIIPYLHLGDKVDIKASFRGKEVLGTGKIAKIYDFADESTSALGLSEYRVKVVIDMQKEEGLQSNEENNITLADIKDGYSVEVGFYVYEAEDKITVPIGAIFKEEGRDYVFKIEDGKAQKQEVELSYISNSFAVVEKGLEIEERIIASADNEEIVDGVKIR